MFPASVIPRAAASLDVLLRGGGGPGQDRCVGAARIQGGQHAIVHQATPRGHLRRALRAALYARLHSAVRVRRLPTTSGGGRRALCHCVDAARQDPRWRQQAQVVPVHSTKERSARREKSSSDSDGERQKQCSYLGTHLPNLPIVRRWESTMTNYWRAFFYCFSKKIRMGKRDGELLETLLASKQQSQPGQPC